MSNSNSNTVRFKVTNKVLDKVTTIEQVIKEEFFLKNKDVDKELVLSGNLPATEWYALLEQKAMGTFLHNERGPAMIVTDEKNKVIHESFRLNGSEITDESIKQKMVHDSDFNDKLNKLINE